MNSPADFDPYKPPDSAHEVEPSEPQGEPVLKDPRWIGHAALTAISIQILVKFLMAFLSEGRDWLVVLTIAHVVAYLASIILFLVWIYRVASNAQRLNRHSGVRPGWAVGSYFIPFVNWVSPILSMRDIIRTTFFRTPPGALPGIAVLWWLSFIVSNVVFRFGRDPLMFGVWFLAIFLSWIGAIILVIRISRCQADFRWSDFPASERVAMVPIASHRPAHPAPDPGRPAAVDIESEWGK